MECAFDFPLAANSLVTRLVAQIGDRIVECSVREKEAAKARYDDAIAGGHAAALAETKKDAVSIKLGNLLPGETATITVGLVEDLDVVGGAWAYSVPGAFFPDYSKHGGSKLPYEFAYELKILAGSKITYLSAPVGSKTDFNADKSEAIITGAEIARQLRVFFRTSAMQVPRLLYEENPQFPDEVAVMASFVPTFEPMQPQEQLVEDEEPDATVLLSPADFLYVFIVDRSGSMSGNRMSITRDAMKLFIKSLPPQSKF